MVDCTVVGMLPPAPSRSLILEAHGHRQSWAGPRELFPTPHDRAQFRLGIAAEAADLVRSIAPSGRSHRKIALGIPHIAPRELAPE